MNIQDFKVSIITPTLNKRPEMLQEAIESVANQTVLVVKEHIIEVDDGRGQAATLNAAVKKAEGDYFIFLADDDKLDPSFIEKTTSEMVKGNWDIVGTFLENFGEETGIHGPRDFPFGTALCKTGLWHELGGYDPKAGPACDADFWLTCIHHGAKWTILPEPLFKSRVHNKQFSKIADWESARIHMKGKHGNKYV